MAAEGVNAPGAGGAAGILPGVGLLRREGEKEGVDQQKEEERPQKAAETREPGGPSPPRQRRTRAAARSASPAGKQSRRAAFPQRQSLASPRKKRAKARTQSR